MILDVYNLSVCGGGGYCVYVSHVCEMERSRNLCFLQSFSQAGSDQETFAFFNLSPRLGPGTLCFRAVMFVPGHTSLQATKYKETI